MVGICFGHQIIAQALGGKVIKHPDGWRVGATQYDIEGQPLTLNAWHQDQVIEAPAGQRSWATPTAARSPRCVWGPHLHGAAASRIRRRHDDALIEHRAPGVVPAPLREQARNLLDTPTDNAAMAARIADIFKKGA